MRIKIVSTFQENSIRRCDLDLLRILATLLLIPYHTARIFYPHSYPYYIESQVTSYQIELIINFIDQWFMPVFFFIAGVAAKISLDTRSEKEYCFERLKRLLVPLLFGIFVLIPPIGYFAFIHHNPDIHLSYYQYYPLFFKINFQHLDGYKGTFTPSHLWFIIYLLCFSFLTLPFFQYLKTTAGKDFISKLANYLVQNPKAIFLYAIPVTLARMLGVVYYNPVYCFLFFVIGFILFLDKQFEETIEKNNSIAFSLALIITVFYLFWHINEFTLASEVLSVKNILIETVLSLGTICWLIVILNFAKQYFNSTNGLIQYLNEASYPIYLIHTSFVLSLGFYVVQWQIGIMLKFVLITFVSTINIFLVYELFIKRFNWMRVLFGMKMKIKNSTDA
jgi:glucans biosynthesis protein C